MRKTANDVLSSWKEIAAYLGKSVRTVQRWEHELALPVRRPVAAKTGIVIGSRAELDTWLQRQAAPGTEFRQAPDFRYRILVVDDNKHILRVSQEVLSRRGYEVRTATDGFQALALMRKALPDVIISDLKMPNMSGFEFLSIVRRRFPHIPVVAITGEFMSTSKSEALLADKLFHKGEYSPEELFTEIHSLLERSPIRPHIPKVRTAPVWLPRNGDYLVVTCPECLRSFSIPQDEGVDEPREVSCIHCQRPFRFMCG
jgi:CheY-like chemotaxis protein